MIKHIVLWKLNDMKDAALIKSRLEALPALIPQIVDFEVGIDFNRSDAAMDVALYSSFRSKEDMKTYAEHPLHKEVASLITSRIQKRHVIDFEV